MSLLAIIPASSHSTGKYRPEIDGLRAIAVGLVILFHFGLTKFGLGGFIGVDIFFVISGFLITKALQNDLQSGWPGLAEFYRRRILRIFPALFVVLGACLCVELAIRFPQAIGSFRDAFIAAVFSVSNFVFAQSKGYFDFASRDNALLHTWSLSVEEQFYLILPLLLLAIRFLPRWGAALLLGFVALASLIAAQMFLDLDADAAFYLVPFRMWEFMAGAALSLELLPKVRSRILAELLAMAGLGLILYASVSLGKNSPFPGVSAIAPVVGSCLVIYGTDANNTLAGRALSLWPMRIIGLISYSLYLWHWPILVYSKYFIASDSRVSKVALISLSIVVALLSWLFVEKPFRRLGRNLVPSKAIKGGLGAMTVLLVTGLLIEPTSKALWPVKPGVQAALDVLDDPRNQAVKGDFCFAAGSVVMKHHKECLTVSRDKQNVLLLGDSHVSMLRPGLTQTYPQVNFLQATAPACTVAESFGNAGCQRLTEFIMKDFLPKNRMNLIILGGRWVEKEIKPLKAAVELLSTYADRVVILGPNQEYSLPFAEVVARARYSDDTRLIERYRMKESSVLDRQMARTDWGRNVDYVSMIDVMCRKVCQTEDENHQLLMFDNDHFTSEGSVYFVKHAVIPGLGKTN